MEKCLSADKKVSGKSKEEQMNEKKQDLEKRLQDVTGQLGTGKKVTKKGKKELEFSENYGSSERESILELTATHIWN